MFGTKQSGINAYANVGLETGVVDASPLKLTVMLYEGAITACIQAKKSIQAGDVVKKGDYITQAISIIDNGLRATLDQRTGGQIANNLDNLYVYMIRTLMKANLHQDIDKINEIQTLLMEVKGAWDELEKSGAKKTPQSQVALDSLVALKAQSYQQMAVAGV